MGKVLNTLDKGFAPIAEFIYNFAKMWGIDIFDRWAGKKRGDFSETTIAQMINELYRNIDLNDTKKISELTRKLEGLIGVNSSPTIKGIINRWKQKLGKQLDEATIQQASRDKDKVKLNALATDLENMDILDYRGDKGEDVKNQIRAHVANVIKEDPSAKERVQKIEGWKKFEPNKYQTSDVEERL